mmetsp:Transcript_3259/g.9019  ORF Transcript_3259/g.9019 Transcript_3259/m.9019 type:complete len:400 (+) Transcript_3259:1441-2640(+)
MQVRINRIQLQLSKDLVVLAAVPQQRANHSVEIPRILDDGPSLGNTLQGLLLKELLLVLVLVFALLLSRLFDAVVHASSGPGTSLLVGLVGANKLVGIAGEVEVLALDVIEFGARKILLVPPVPRRLLERASHSRLVGQHEVDRLQPGNGRPLFAGHQGDFLDVLRALLLFLLVVDLVFVLVIVVLITVGGIDHPRQKHPTPGLVGRRPHRSNRDLSHQRLLVRFVVRVAHERDRLRRRVEPVDENALRDAVVPVLPAELPGPGLLAGVVLLALLQSGLLGLLVLGQAQNGAVAAGPAAALPPACLASLAGFARGVLGDPHALHLAGSGLDRGVVLQEHVDAGLELNGVLSDALGGRPLVGRVDKGGLQNGAVRGLDAFGGGLAGRQGFRGNAFRSHCD